MVQTEVENITIASSYISELLYPVFMKQLGNISIEEMRDAFTRKAISAGQHSIDNELLKMTKRGMLGLNEITLVLMPTAIDPQPLVVFSSNESHVYNWKVPDHLAPAIEDDEPYIWMENGIPELGLAGESLGC